MKILRYSVIPLLLLLTLIMASCVQSPALTLVAVDVRIEEQLDRSLVQGEGEDKVEIYETVLHYKFNFENTSRKTIGSMQKPLYVSIEHETDLIPNASKLGGRGYNATPIIAPNQVGEFEIYYGLGVKDTKGLQVHPLPGQEVLDEIESEALNATLVVTEGHADRSEPGLPRGEKELMRIDLREYKD